MLKEFKEFAMRGNVLDMAVGIIIGAAFGKIVTSFVGETGRHTIIESGIRRELYPRVCWPGETDLDHLEFALKYEGLNPSCSFKDRGMTVAVSKAKERGATVVICASTGNTSASAAACRSR